MEKNQGRRRTELFSLMFSFICIRGTSRVRNNNYIATTAFQGTTYLITRSRQLAQDHCNGLNMMNSRQYSTNRKFQ